MYNFIQSNIIVYLVKIKALGRVQTPQVEGNIPPQTLLTPHEGILTHQMQQSTGGHRGIDRASRVIDWCFPGFYVII